VAIYLAVTLINGIGGDNRDAGSDRRGPRPGPVLPTELAGDHGTIDLRGRFDAVALAAGGRYLILRTQDPSQLVVFDPNAAAIVKTLDLDDPKAVPAGTAAKLFVYRPRAHRLDRYDLVTWEKERSVPKPEGLTSVEILLAGPGSDGPVLLVGERGLTGADVVAVDAGTLAADPVREVEWHRGLARVSHDGRLVGNVGAGPAAALSGAILVRPVPGGWFETSRLQATRGLGHAAPSPDGRFVYTAVGVFKPDGTRKLQPAEGDYFFTLPTAQGSDLFVSLGVDTAGTEAMLRGPARLHLADDRAAVADLPAAAPRGFTPLPGRGQGVPADQRVYLWPAAGLLAVLPATGKSIELYKVDVAKLLKQSRKGYLLIGSDPPTAAARGTTWSYQPVVWSNGDLPPTLEVKGPPGMGMSPKQTLTWPVPADFPEPEVQVKVQVTDKTGRTAEQAFRIVLTEGPGA
jgi:hypothetical protein